AYAPEEIVNSIKQQLNDDVKMMQLGNNQLFIQFPEDMKSKTLILHSLLGTKVYEAHIDGKNGLYITEPLSISPGVYVLSIQREGGLSSKVFIID
ncbi:MAG: T9SS type A sorting domain-containing protein, partial [Ignavibacteria bacterium]